ncbi:hypothetical protein NL438_26350, partial [Klebsiella pneumoniae]|nr:hypothetical protein [Klebsiella pneumoniae]
ATTSDFMPFLWAFLGLVGLVTVRRSTSLPPVVKVGFWGLMAVLFFLFDVHGVVLGWLHVKIPAVMHGLDAKFWGVVVMGGSVLIM